MSKSDDNPAFTMTGILAAVVVAAVIFFVVPKLDEGVPSAIVLVSGIGSMIIFALFNFNTGNHIITSKYPSQKGNRSLASFVAFLSMLASLAAEYTLRLEGYPVLKAIMPALPAAGITLAVSNIMRGPTEEEQNA